MRACFVLLLVAAPLSAQQANPPARRASNGGLPAFSPDGSRIAFIADIDGTSDVYVINADGSGRKRLTSTPAYESAPAWSKDGKSVIFAVGRDTSHIYRVDVSSGAQQEIAVIAGNGAAFSPDGRKMAFGAGTMPSTTLSIANADGSGPTAMNGASPAFNMAWSPEGRQIAYTTFTPQRETQVRVVNADGTSSRILMRSDSTEGSPQWPSWSPDGRRLAVQVGKYSRDATQNTAHIWIFDLITGAKTKLGTHTRPYLDETPSWSRDGRIAFQSDRTGRMEVWTMNADGTDLRQITR